MSSPRPQAADTSVPPLPPGHRLLAALGRDARLSTARPADGVAVFAIRGEIDYRNSPQLQHELRHATEDQPARVVLDLVEMISTDSSGVATLLDAMTRVRRYGGVFRLVAPPQRVLAVMRICQLTDVFEIRSTEREAIET